MKRTYHDSTAANLEESDDEEVYMTVAERKRLALQKRGGGGKRTVSDVIRRQNDASNRGHNDSGNESGDGVPHEGEGENEEGRGGKANQRDGGEDLLQEISAPAKARGTLSLLDQAYVMKKKEAENPMEALMSKMKREEEEVMHQVANAQVQALSSVMERAQGIIYTEPMKTTWRPFPSYRRKSEAENDDVRKKLHIIVEGEDVPPPIKKFKDMRLPDAVLKALQAKGIQRPTPIQVQGIPTILSGRDVIGIAFTGSGKTLVFSLPLILFSLEEEIKMPLGPGEGPIGVIVSPSRELAKQTAEVIEFFTSRMAAEGLPELRTMCCIGGEDGRTQMEVVGRGVHMIAATPGRLNDFLKKQKIFFSICKYIALDEADRMLDLGFDEEMQSMLNHFPHQRQTLLFSATMPKKFQDFAKSALVKPVLVNVGRAGAANLDVIQEVEYVKEEAKLIYLLECLQKTPPPVLIFCDSSSIVDDIHEYLLLKGVDATSIHGGKDQEERNYAIRVFKDGKADVLVASDIAAKGLDFPDIQHVINYDMPDLLEDYVHRIGRTGRSGKTGVATTFINKSVPEAALLDLKHLLVEAKQRVPPVLMTIHDPDELILDDITGSKGCSYCGNLGHRVNNCSKLEADKGKIGGQTKEFIKNAGGEY
jgi:ATP-dependent RNA helicase DDX41